MSRQVASALAPDLLTVWLIAEASATHSPTLRVVHNCMNRVARHAVAYATPAQAAVQVIQ